MKIVNCKLKIKEMNNEFKLEDLFKNLEHAGIKLLQNRFLIDKTTAIVPAVILVSAAGFFVPERY